MKNFPLYSKCLRLANILIKLKKHGVDKSGAFATPEIKAKRGRLLNLFANLAEHTQIALDKTYIKQKNGFAIKYKRKIFRF